MSQHKLTEQEIRSLASKFATETIKHPASYYVGAKEWFSEYIAKYNEAINVIEKYNQSLDS